MPRFSTINERRYRLHEVVRLSGINIEVDGEDYPLIIGRRPSRSSSSSLFLDNETYLGQKHLL